jgi:hypothetical protein
MNSANLVHLSVRSNVTSMQSNVLFNLLLKDQIQRASLQMRPLQCNTSGDLTWQSSPFIGIPPGPRYGNLLMRIRSFCADYTENTTYTLQPTKKVLIRKLYKGLYSWQLRYIKQYIPPVSLPRESSIIAGSYSIFACSHSIYYSLIIMLVEKHFLITPLACSILKPLRFSWVQPSYSAQIIIISLMGWLPHMLNVWHIHLHVDTFGSL